MQSQSNVEAIWNKVVDQVKMTVIHPTLWRCLESAVPVTMEENEFVVGFPAGTYHMSGYLNSGEHRNAIETAIKEFTGQPLKLRIIEGGTLEDWATAKTKDRNVQLLKEENRRKREKESNVNQSWDSLLERISRTYIKYPLRQLPQYRARYLSEMLEAIIETMDEVMPDGRSTDELTERSLGRAIDKVAQMIDVPPTMVAMELLRLYGKN
jgi:hypothetical protein